MTDLFDRLKTDKFVVIDEVVRLHYQETAQLDFKEKEDAGGGELSKSDRRVLGPALSALANSAGGSLIWGIEARKDGDGIDAAQRLVPISDIARFSSDVSRAVGELLSPRHDGIEILTIEDPGKAGAGYLAIRVERSPRRPHMSMAAGDRRYYKRAGDSSFVMEHYDVEDAFNRTAPAELKMVLAEIKSGERPATAGQAYTDYYLVFVLANEDHTSACAPYVWLDGITGGGTLLKVGDIEPSRRAGARPCMAAALISSYIPA